MSELTDDQLDGLFRKSAEEFDPPFDPAAWQDMKARLDANDHTRPGGTFTWKNLLRWGLSALLLLSLTGGGWYAYRKANRVGRPTAVSSTDTPVTSQPNKTANENSHPKTSRLADADPQRAQPVGLPVVGSDDVEPSSDRTGLVNRNSNRIDPKNRSNASTERLPATAKTETLANETVENKTERATKKASRAYRRVIEPNRTPQSQRMTAAGERGRDRAERTKKSSRQSVAVATNRSVRRQRDNRRGGASFSESAYAITTLPSFTRKRITGERTSKLPSTKSSTGEAVRSENLLNDTSINPSSSSITVSELAIRPAKWLQPLSFANRSVQSNPDTVVRKSVSKLAVQRGLSVRVAVAPDLSGVGLKNFSRPGTNVGLFLEYRFASRWSVQAGLIQSTKVYRALPGEYGNLPDYLEKYSANLAQVDGRCSMFDIPVNIRYDVIVKPQRDGQQSTRWFVSGGITSYIMKQENYDYSYYRYYPMNIDNWSTSSGGYGFSNLNLSLGYERALSKRLSWQVEPFIKVPLKGVGYFKVDLLSTGAFFSLRYKL